MVYKRYEYEESMHNIWPLLEIEMMTVVLKAKKEYVHSSQELCNELNISLKAKKVSISIYLGKSIK